MRLLGGSPLQWRLQTLHKAGSLLGTKYRSHEPEHLCLENVHLLTRLVVFQGFEMFFLNFKNVSVFARCATVLTVLHLIYNLSLKEDLEFGI